MRIPVRYAPAASSGVRAGDRLFAGAVARLHPGTEFAYASGCDCGSVADSLWRGAALWPELATFGELLLKFPIEIILFSAVNRVICAPAGTLGAFVVAGWLTCYCPAI